MTCTRFCIGHFLDSLAKTVHIFFCSRNKELLAYYCPSEPLSTHAKFGDVALRTLGGDHGHTNKHTYIHAYIHIHIHMHTHVLIQTYTHTYKHLNSSIMLIIFIITIRKMCPLAVIYASLFGNELTDD